MTTILETHAKEKSTYVITVSFFDEDDNAIVPISITWTLSDMAGNIVNARSAVVVTIPAASVNVVLTNLDLAIQLGELDETLRILEVSAVYNSAAGNGLLLKDHVLFFIDDIKVIS